ncbi:MAG: DUF2339 domain-containing protein [Thermodesulfobacteriota bacterium]|nr:DUF2339 domain-containing protein [Thermodesulfobacteriota bacterium]
MQCPKCANVVSKSVQYCPACGYDLRIYLSLHTLKDDLGKIKTDAFSLSEKIDLLQSRFIQLENLIPITISGAQKPVTPTSHQNGSLSKEPEQEMTARQQKPPPLPTGQKPGIESRPPQTIRSGESEIRFGQKWLLIAGVVLTVLAVGWFLKYSFEKDWVGPAGRVAMAYLMGMTFLGSGEFFRRKEYDIFGLYLIGGGIATLYFATFAAFQIYHLLSQAPAFGIMALVTTLAGVLSLVHDTKWLAVLGLIGGFLTPVILSTGRDNQLALMTYMTILNAGILSVAFFKQWRLLNYLGFLLTWLLFSTWYYNHYAEHKFWKTIIYLNIFFLIYAFVPFAYHILKEHGKRLRGIEIIMPNAFIAFGFSFAMIRANYQVECASIVTLSYAAIFLWMAQFIYRRDSEQLGAFVMMIAKGTFFLVLTVPILFSDHWITFFWTIQAVVLLWAGLKLQNRWLYNSFVALLVLAIFKFLFYDYSEVFLLKFQGFYFRAGYTRLLLERFITSAAVLASVSLSIGLIKRYGAENGTVRQKDTAIFWGIFSGILFLIMNIEVGAFSHDYASKAGFAATSVLWALFSIVMMVLGFLKARSLLRRCAIGLFGITLIKVFFVDMTNVSTPYRVVSFMILGLMLISASYLYHRFKDRILPHALREESAQ